MKMTENYKILAKFIKDLSSEANTETCLFVRDNIAKYQLGIDITSKALKIKWLKLIQNLNLKIKKKTKKNHILK